PSTTLFRSSAGANTQPVAKSQPIAVSEIVVAVLAVASVSTNISLSARPVPFPTRSAARRPKGPPNYRRRVCRGERRAPPLADNRAPSIGWREIRQSPPVASRALLSVASQFHSQSP